MSPVAAPANDRNGRPAAGDGDFGRVGFQKRLSLSDKVTPPVRHRGPQGNRSGGNGLSGRPRPGADGFRPSAAPRHAEAEDAAPRCSPP